MTPFTDEEATELLRENGAFLAAQLGMIKVDDPMELRDKQPVLLVTKDNITLGETFVREATSPAYHYEILAVRCSQPQDIYERQFHRTTSCSRELAETSIRLPRECTIYVGY